jgi:hypothetical protein
MSARETQEETEAREHIAMMLESGVTLAAYARPAGIDGRSLCVGSSRASSSRFAALPDMRVPDLDIYGFRDPSESCSVAD